MVDVVIIGAGPAGLTAGLYAKRGGHSVVIFEEKAAGGQIVNAKEVAFHIVQFVMVDFLRIRM